MLMFTTANHAEDLFARKGLSAFDEVCELVGADPAFMLLVSCVRKNNRLTSDTVIEDEVTAVTSRSKFFSKAGLSFYIEQTAVLDNFSACSLEYGGVRYPTLEHAYQVGKFHDLGIREIIFHQTSPWRAQEMARTHRNKKRVDWNELAKLSLMRELIRLKTEQYFEIQVLLYHCHSIEITEGGTNPFWGRHGKNWMGRLWMERRDILYQKVLN